ncbi:hypothetical protein PUN28_005884 [Cardiocondyla obscurior]|uniref:Uncharacterized protein n=1 Tax=Cardiocondyla obscurior TaxID=286306 RepID=A0AAW2G6P0_9HYME
MAEDSMVNLVVSTDTVWSNNFRAATQLGCDHSTGSRSQYEHVDIVGCQEGLHGESPDHRGTRYFKQT